MANSIDRTSLADRSLGRVLLTLIGIWLLVITLALVSGCHDDDRTADDQAETARQVQDLFTKALKLINSKEGQADKRKRLAAAQLQKAHRLAPEDDRIAIALADLYRDGILDTGELRDGPTEFDPRLKMTRRLYEQVLAGNSDDTAALTGLGALLIHQDEYKLALKHLMRAKELKPDSLIIDLTLGRCLYEMGRLTEAKEVFDGLLAEGKLPEGGNLQRMTLDYLGRIHFKRGEIIQAEKLFHRAADGLEQLNRELGTVFGCPYENLGLLYLTAGLNQQAAKNYRLAADTLPDKAEPQLDSALAAYVAGDYRTALEYLERADKLEPKPEYEDLRTKILAHMTKQNDQSPPVLRLAEAADFFAKINYLEQALSYADSALNAEDDPRLRRKREEILARLAADPDRTSEAGPESLDDPAAAEMKVRKSLGLARMQIRAGEHQMARKLLARSAGLAPDNPEIAALSACLDRLENNPAGELSVLCPELK